MTHFNPTHGPAKVPPGSQLLRLTDENYFVRAFQEAGIGMALVSPLGEYLEVNPALCSILGFSREELLGRRFVEVTHPDDVESSIILQQQLLGGQAAGIQVEKRFVRKDGSVVWVFLTVSCLRNPDGTPHHLISQFQDITERKLAQQAVSEIEGSLDSLWAGSRDGMRLLSADGLVLHVNEAYCRIVGLPRAEIVGRPFSVAYGSSHEEQERARRNFNARFLARNIRPFQEAQVQLWDGRSAWLELSNSFLHYRGQDVLLSVVRDLTERKDAQEDFRRLVTGARCLLWRAEVRERERPLRKPNCPEQWLHWDFRVTDLGTVLDFIPLEIDPNEPIGDAWSRSFHPDDRGPMCLRGEAAIRGGEPGYGHRFRIRLRDGSYRWMREEVTIHQVADRPRRWKCVGVVTDVTTQVEAEEALRRAEENYRSIFENATEGIFQTSPDGRFLAVNPALARMLGWPNPQSLLDADLLVERDLYADPTERRRYLEAMHADGRVRAREYQIRRRDGSRIWVSENARAVCDGAGELLFFEGTLEDITQKMSLAEEMRRARETAERASQAKTAFLATISHEILTPLNGILGMNELVLDGPLSPDQRECLEAAQRSARDLMGLLKDVLDYSKLETTGMQLESVGFSLEEPVGAVFDNLAVRARQKGLELEARLSHHVPARLLGDPQRLRQVLLNLVSNAVKFTEVGSVRLTVEVLEAARESALLQFCVADTGVGIAPDQQEAIFAAFVQADNSSTRRYGGTGLGLAICSQLVRQWGGRIWVESEEGRGSRFYFTARFELPRTPRPRPGTDGPGQGYHGEIALPRHNQHAAARGQRSTE